MWAVYGRYQPDTRPPARSAQAPCCGGKLAAQSKDMQFRAGLGYHAASPAGVAQQAEQPSCKRQVSGSNPLTGSQVNGVNDLLALGRVDRFVDRMTLIRAILLLCRESPKVA